MQKHDDAAATHFPADRDAPDAEERRTLDVFKFLPPTKWRVRRSDFPPRRLQLPAQGVGPTAKPGLGTQTKGGAALGPPLLPATSMTDACDPEASLL